MSHRRILKIELFITPYLTIDLTVNCALQLYLTLAAFRVLPLLVCSKKRINVHYCRAEEHDVGFTF
jgi:hypothetical protein